MATLKLLTPKPYWYWMSFAQRQQNAQRIKDERIQAQIQRTQARWKAMWAAKVQWWMIIMPTIRRNKSKPLI